MNPFTDVPDVDGVTVTAQGSVSGTLRAARASVPDSSYATCLVVGVTNWADAGQSVTLPHAFTVASVVPSLTGGLAAATVAGDQLTLPALTGPVTDTLVILGF